MDKRLLFLFAFFLVGKIQVQACSCIYIETFCETLSYSDTLHHDLIIYGVVTGKSNAGMEVEVLEKLYGEDKRRTVFIKSGNGADCGEYTGRFDIGQEMVLALYMTYDRDNMENTYYYLSICGVNYLLVENGNVKGKIAPGVVFQSYDQFKKSSTCSIFENFDPQSPSDPEYKVFPNPARDQIFLTPKENMTLFTYALSDIQGRTIINGIRKEVEAESLITIDLPVDQMSAGMYLLRISSELGSQTRKIIINNM